MKSSKGQSWEWSVTVAAFLVGLATTVTLPAFAGIESSGISAGYERPRWKQGVADAYMFNIGDAQYPARYAVFGRWGIGLKIYNLFWAGFEPSVSTPEHSGYTPSAITPPTCPDGYFVFPTSAAQKAQLGFHRYHCYHAPGVAMYDANFRNDAAYGIQTAVVLWTAPYQAIHPGCRGTPNDLGKMACVPSGEVALQDYEDHIAYLAWRYNGEQGNGKIYHYVLWNEVDSSLWFDMSPDVDDTNPSPSAEHMAKLTRHYATMMKIAHRAIGRFSHGVLLHASLTNHWLPSSLLAGKTHIGGINVLDGLWRELGVSFDWSVAFHAYDDPLDNSADSKITFSELGEVVGYQRQRLAALGLDPDRYPQQLVFASEQGWPQGEGGIAHQAQARNVCHAHDLVSRMPSVIGTTHNWLQEQYPPFGAGVDSPGSYALLPIESGVNLAGRPDAPTFRAYEATGVGQWRCNDSHYCCSAHGVGCARGRSHSALADFTGDGYADYADQHVPSGSFWVHGNLRTGAFTPMGVNVAEGRTMTGPDWDVMTADFNGDGRADFADAHRNGTFWVHLNDGAGGFSPSDWAWGRSPGGGCEVELHAGDFDGDGAADVAARNVATGGLALRRNLRTGGPDSFVDLNLDAGRSMPGPEWRTVVADFNGDGRADFADQHLPSGQFWIHANRGAPSFAFDTANFGWGQAAGGPDWLTLFGDFTGDGCADFADLLQVGALAGHFWIHAGDCHGAFYAWNWGEAQSLAGTSADWRLLGQ